MPRRKASLKKSGTASSRLRNRLPHIWLMTDPRLGDRLLPAIQALPAGSGVIFRHYDLPAEHRQRLFYAVRTICRRRGHRLLLASPPKKARHWDMDGLHNRKSGRRTYLSSASVHDLKELKSAAQQKADLIFVSPVYPTRSHPNARHLGPSGLKHISSHPQCSAAIIALGGMTRPLAAMFKNYSLNGWAGIGGFSRGKLVDVTLC
jgi:thiamine-phosphate pyrophosphorylase